MRFLGARQLGGLGSAVRSPSVVRGKASAAQRFCGMLFSEHTHYPTPGPKFLVTCEGVVLSQWGWGLSPPIPQQIEHCCR